MRTKDATAPPRAAAAKCNGRQETKAPSKLFRKALSIICPRYVERQPPSPPPPPPQNATTEKKTRKKYWRTLVRVRLETLFSTGACRTLFFVVFLGGAPLLFFLSRPPYALPFVLLFRVRPAQFFVVNLVVRTRFRVGPLSLRVIPRLIFLMFFFGR